MLKKIAYVVVTSGLFLAPLGASAMVTDSPFPACVGPDCTIASYDGAQKDSIAALGESAKKNWVSGEKHTSNSSFPADNSHD